MTAKYISDYKEWLVNSIGRRYIISRSNNVFILEEIEPPCNDLKYISEFNTLGDALEAVMRDEMHESGGADNENS